MKTLFRALGKLRPDSRPATSQPPVRRSITTARPGARWPRSILLLAAALTTPLNAGIMDPAVGVQTYRDFAENRGRFFAGAKNVPIYYQDSGDLVGYIIEVPDWDNSIDPGGHSLVGHWGFLASVGHNRRSQVTFINRFYPETYRPGGESNQEFNSIFLDTYHVIQENHMADKRPPEVVSYSYDYDISVPRLAKIVTEAEPKEYFLLKNYYPNSTYPQAAMTEKTFRSGAGRQTIATGENQEESVGSGYHAGGTVLFDNGKQTRSDPDAFGLYSKVYPVSAESPLRIGTRKNDSGSPTLIYNPVTERIEFLGPHQSGGKNRAGFGTFGQTRSANEWAISVIEAYDVRIENPGEDPITWEVTASGSGQFIQNGHVLANSMGLPDNLRGATSQVAADGVSQIYPADNHKIAGRDGFIRVNEPLDATKNLIFDGVGTRINLLSPHDLGAGSMTFHADYTLSGARLNTAGMIVESGATVTTEITGIAGDEWRKVGLGTLVIAGSGENQARLNTGGGGLTILDRQNGSAVSHIKINGGDGTKVRIAAPGQIAGTSGGSPESVVFGHRGGTLDLYGHDASWAGITHLDEGAAITNTRADSLSSFEYTLGGEQKFLGSFSDGGDISTARLNVIYNPVEPGEKSGPWTLHGNISNHGTWTIHSGEVNLAGRPTPLAGLVLDDANWIRARFDTGLVTIRNGAKFTVGQEADVTSDFLIKGAGALALDSYKLSFSGAVTLSDFASLLTVAAAAGESLHLPGTISGTGIVRKTGAGTLGLPDITTFNGEVHLEQGSLSISGSSLNAQGVTLHISSGAKLELDDVDLIMSEVWVDGVRLTDQTYTGGFITGGGSLIVSRNPLAPFIWINPGGGSWGVASNWNKAEVPAFTENADLQFTTTGLTEPVVTTLDGDRTANRLTFGNPVQNFDWVIRSGNPADSTLILNPSGSRMTAEVNVRAGNVRLEAPLTASASLGFDKMGSGGLELLNGNNLLAGEVKILGGSLTIPHGSNTCDFTIKPTDTYDLLTRIDLVITGNAVFEEDSDITLFNAATGDVRNARVRLISESGNNVLENPLLIQSGSHQEVHATAGQLRLKGGILASDEPSALIMLRGSSGQGFVSGPIQLGESCVLVKTDDGLWEISASGNNWGSTNLSRGTLRMGAEGVLPPTTALRIGRDSSNRDAILDLNGFDQEVAELTAELGSGGRKAIISDSPAVLTIANESDTHYAGSLSGAISIRKRGSGNLTLTGTADINGELFIDGGTLTPTRALLETVSSLKVSYLGKLELSEPEPVRLAQLWYAYEFLPPGIYDAGNAPFITGSGSLEVLGSPVENDRLFWRPFAHTNHQGDLTYDAKWESSPTQLRWSTSADPFVATAWDNNLHADFTADFTGDDHIVWLVDQTIKVRRMVFDSGAPMSGDGLPKMNYNLYWGSIDFGTSTGMIELNSANSYGVGLELNFVGSAGLAVHARDKASDHLATQPTGIVYLLEPSTGLSGGIFIENGFVGFPEASSVGTNPIRLKGDSGIVAPTHDFDGSIVSKDGANVELNNRIELAGESHAFFVPAGRTLTLLGEIEGVNGFTKAGAGTLVLNNSESRFLGATTVKAGELRLAVAALDSNSALHLEDGYIVLESSVSQQVTQLVIDGVDQGFGEFDSSHLSGRILGEGQIIVPQAPTMDEYGAWLALDPGSANGVGTGRRESLDRSGVPNIIQFGMGGHPGDPRQNGFRQIVRTDDGQSDHTHVLTIAVREDAEFTGSPQLIATASGIHYTIEASHDLVDWTAEVEEIPVILPNNAEPLLDGYVYKSFRIAARSDWTQVFYKVRVE